MSLVRQEDIQPPTSVDRLRRYLNWCKGYQVHDFGKRPPPHSAVAKYLLFLDPCYVTGRCGTLADRNDSPPRDGTYIEWSDTEVAYRDLRSERVRASDILFLVEQIRNGQNRRRMDIIEVKPANHADWDRRSLRDKTIDLEETAYHPDTLDTLAAARRFYSGLAVDVRCVEVVYAVAERPPTVRYQGVPGESVQVRNRRRQVVIGHGQRPVHLCGAFDVTDEAANLLMPALAQAKTA